jgi:HD superfamily phosphohydrolase
VLIRDPIHGDLSLSEIELEILDAPEVQRLRGIKQLGTASLVYPGCVHTRFDHSLGTNALAKRILESLKRQGREVPEEVETAVAAAALLHDVTHVPFGHTLEDERRLFPRHDKGERFAKLLAGPLGDRLDRLAIKNAVTSILAPHPVASDERRATSDTMPSWARQIVSSTIDADLLDYLKRDSYFAGLAQSYDDRIFRYFSIEDDQLVIDMAKHGMERPDARSETVQLLRMRYFLTERVYYHHTKVAAGAMVSKAVELALAHGRMGEDELAQLNDWSLFERLCEIPDARCADRRIVDLVERLRRRRILKRGYVISAATVPQESRRTLVARYHESGDNRRQAEEYLAQAAGCEAAEVIVYCPALSVMKEASALVRLPRGIVRLNDPQAEANAEIQALEARYAQLWRLYVFAPPDHGAPIAGAAAEVFGYPSEHRAG